MASAKRRSSLSSMRTSIHSISTRIMWAISVRVNPAQDVMIYLNLSVNQLTRSANRNRAKQCNPNVERTSNSPQKKPRRS
jgi:hypothetical protein